MDNKIKNAVDLFDKYAMHYQTRYMSVEKYEGSLDLLLNSLHQKNAEILELACGPGNITKYLLAQNPDLNILATDLAPSMLKLAKDNNPGASFQFLDCRSILDLNKKFDAIICGFGMPYLTKMEALQMIEDASKSLNKEGLIYLSTMEDDYEKSGFKAASSNPNEGLLMYFHEADYLVEELEKQNFGIIDISRVMYLDNNGEDVTDLIIIGKKNN